MAVGQSGRLGHLCRRMSDPQVATPFAAPSSGQEARREGSPNGPAGATRAQTHSGSGRSRREQEHSGLQLHPLSCAHAQHEACVKASVLSYPHLTPFRFQKRKIETRTKTDFVIARKLGGRVISGMAGRFEFVKELAAKHNEQVAPQHPRMDEYLSLEMLAYQPPEMGKWCIRSDGFSLNGGQKYHLSNV